MSLSPQHGGVGWSDPALVNRGVRGVRGVFGRSSGKERQNRFGNLMQTRAAAAPSAQQAVKTKMEPTVVPLTRVDEVGAISIVEPHEKDYVVREFENVDGRRIEDGRYAAFIEEISGRLCRRIDTDMCSSRW